MCQSDLGPCSQQLPSHHQTTFIPPMSSLTHSLNPLRETEGAATGLIFLHTLCPLLITAGGCFHFSPAPVDIIWGKDGGAHGVGWLGVLVGSADGLHFSFLTQILPTPQCGTSWKHMAQCDPVLYYPWGKKMYWVISFVLSCVIGRENISSSSGFSFIVMFRKFFCMS